MKTDVLIIGGGLSAYCAAYEVIKNSRLQVDMLCWGGGASAYIHGFCLPCLPEDSEELFYRDSMESGYYQSRETLVRRLCKESLELPAYFQGLGLDIDRDENGPRLIKSLGSSAARIAGIGNNTGPVMLNTLRKQLNGSGCFREHRHLRALELLKKDGAVVGARCYNKDTDAFQSFGAGVVVLATGGFGRLFPQSTNSPDIGGDGCAMALLAGGSITDMEFIQFEPSAAVWPEPLIGKSIITTMFYEGAVLRGGDGKRFMNEKVSKDLQAKAIAAQIRSGNTTPHGGVWFDATEVPDSLWDTIYKPYLNRYLAHGIDMRTEPVEIAPAAHTTCGGVLIDENCRTGVVGLIACGEVTGGLHGANRLGGNAGLETMVFGRIAGLTAVADFKEAADLAEEITPNRQRDVTRLKAELGNILQKNLGVLRVGAELEAGILELDKLLEQMENHENCFEAHRLYNDLLTAKMAFLSALRRKSTVGCHCREDSTPEEKYRILIKNTPAGLSVSTQPV